MIYYPHALLSLILVAVERSNAFAFVAHSGAQRNFALHGTSVSSRSSTGDANANANDTPGDVEPETPLSVSLPLSLSIGTGVGTEKPRSRRRVFADVLSRSSAVAACACCLSSPLFLPPQPARGLAQITTPTPQAIAGFDPPRNPFADAAFAQGMAVGMVDYERAAYPKKKELFRALFSSLSTGIGERREPGSEPVVVEIGMGSFPNALYYKGAAEGLDIIGVDPNDWMAGYARDNAQRAGLLKGAGNDKNNNNNNNNNINNLRIVHGVSEALPLRDASCDAVVCTLTLCSVVDPVRSVAEIKRVLKPGGKFLFWEHVLSETDPGFARQQILNTPLQVKRADGCHLDRRTGEIIKGAGFAKLDLQYLELEKFGFLNPTVCGIGTV